MHTIPARGGRSGPRIVIAVLTGLVALIAMSAMATAAPNKGTIKVHDDEVVDPPTQNQPHVSCDFWIQGFSMEGEEGLLVFQAWPPTGEKEIVDPDGDSLDWSADQDGNFLNGEYQLEPGHYKVTATSEGEKDKSKVFWVDECEPAQTTGTTGTAPTTEIPVFPTATALALGTLGALGGAFLVLRRKA